MLVPTNKVAAEFVSGNELSGFAGRCSQRPLHDGAGNPTSYFNPGDLSTWTLSWKNGRELGKAVKSGTTLSFDYDVNGLRTWKQVDGVRHNYTYASGLLLRESYSQNGTDYTLDFLYDLNNRPYMLYLTTKIGSTTTSRPYYYILNLQGDVVHLVNTAGKAMASYTYDPYGAILTKSGEFADLNPIRYRGYYYDTETGFYYLQSRYYDPALGRFINADSYASTGQEYIGYNMFAYCGNNPVTRNDRDGKFWNIVIGAVVGAVVNTALTVADSVINNKPIDLGDVAISAVSGAVSGAIAATGFGIMAQAGMTAATNAVTTFTSETYHAIKKGGISAAIRNLPNAALKSLDSGLKGAVYSLAGTGAGKVVGKYVTKTSKKADAFFDKYLEKTFNAGIHKSAGRSTSALLRQANKALSRSRFYDNLTNGVTSVIGSAIGGCGDFCLNVFR